MSNTAVAENILFEWRSHLPANIFTCSADGTFGREDGSYTHLDFGTNSIEFEKPHLWVDFEDKRRCPHMTFRVFLYATAKSESTFAYKIPLLAMIRCVHTLPLAQLLSHLHLQYVFHA